MKKPLMMVVTSLLLVMTALVALCTPTINAFAQIRDKVPRNDGNDNRNPWYALRPNNEQSRSEIDISFAPTEMKMVQPSPEEIRALREKRGLRLKDVADTFGKSLESISAYEHGRVRVPPGLAECIKGIKDPDAAFPPSSFRFRKFAIFVTQFSFSRKIYGIS